MIKSNCDCGGQGNALETTKMWPNLKMVAIVYKISQKQVEIDLKKVACEGKKILNLVKV